MKKVRRAVYILAAAAAILIPQLSQGEVIDKIVVVVNNEVITQREIDSLLVPVYEQYKETYKGPELVKRLEAARQNIIEQLIDDRLIMGEAKRLNIEITDKEIDGRLAEIQERAGSKKRFDEMMMAQGMNIKDLRNRYKEQMMSRKLIDHRVGSTVNLTPAEVSEYYNAHKAEFVQPEQVRLKNILIKPRENLPAEKARLLADNILSKLKEDGDFADLANRFSDGPFAAEGGLMDYSRKGDLMPEIENVVFALKAGDLSPVIQTSLGYHIFKVEEKIEGRPLELSDVRRHIEETIFRTKARDKLKDWLDGLKKNAYIAFK